VFISSSYYLLISPHISRPPPICPPLPYTTLFRSLLEHPDVAAISFTGSVGTGRKIAQACVLSNPMKKFQLEMGGKNPLVVLDDRSEEHTSELQSRFDLVCRLLLEKKRSKFRCDNG